MKKRKIISSIYSRDLLYQANNISDDLWDFQNKLVGDPRLSDFFTVEDIEAMDRVRVVLDEFAVQRDDINSSTCSASRSITAGKVFDYDSRITYNRGRNKFSVYMKNSDDPENFQCTVSMIKPYDDADYGWARKWSPRTVDIIQKGKVMDQYTLPEYDEDNYETPTEYIDEVLDTICTALLDWNRDIEPRMIHN